MGDQLKENFTKEKLAELDLWFKQKKSLVFPKTAKPKLSIILVLYNRAELTLACLKSILEYGDLDYEIIIFNNQSTDSTVDLLDKVENVKVIHSKDNLGFLKACNKAAKFVKGEYILLLNNDAVIHERTLSNGLKPFYEDENIGAVGGKIILLSGKLQEAGSIVFNDGSCLGYGRNEEPDAAEYMFQRETDYCSGALLFTPTKLWNKLEGFDEAYAPAYYEETDYCLRLKKLGYKTIYVPSSQITHFEFGSSSKSDDAIKLQKTNRKTFLEKHKDVLWKFYIRKDINIIKSRIGNLNRKKRILFIEDRIPHNHIGSGFPRSNMIVNGMVEIGYEVSIYPINFHDFGQETWDQVYQDLDTRIEILYDDARFSHVNYDLFFKNRNDYYDIIWVSRPHNMDFFNDHYQNISDYIVNASIIYDAEAVFSNREILQNNILNQGKSEDELQRLFELEMTYPKFASKIVTVNKREKKQFIDKEYTNVNILNVAYKIEPTENKFSERKDLLFVGNMDYTEAPNVDSMLWFYNNSWASIKSAIPEIKLHLVGSNKSDDLNELADLDDQIIIHGKVDSLVSIFNDCKLFIAPTRFAAGSPAKLFQSFCLGLPTVISPLLHLQMQNIDGTHYKVGELEGEPFAQAILEVYNDESKWKSIRKNALDLVKEEFSKEQFIKTLDLIL